MKRWYQTIGIQPTPEGFAVTLDGKPVMTPSRRPLRVPTHVLSLAIAEEWANQEGDVIPAAMPLMRLAATAIDRVAPDRGRALTTLMAHAGSDLVCFRAERPAELVARQTRCWQPLVNWAARHHDVVLTVTTGVMPLHQPVPVLLALEKVLDPFDSWHLVALHAVTTLTGSLIIALALHAKQLTGEEAFSAGALDNLWSLEVWGHDDEAQCALEVVKAQILMAERFLHLLQCHRQ